MLILTLMLPMCVCYAVTVTQREHFKTIQEGTGTNIDCEIDDSSYYTVLWYQQKSDGTEKGLQLIGHSVHENVQMEMKEYSISKLNVTHSSLSVPQTQAAESAVYYCAASKERNISGHSLEWSIHTCKCEHSSPYLTLAGQNPAN
uniref:Ig-like domain-containing protein n=1 Tax=Salvator merianae TaxID=96440 RepID=A0A8D0BI60_SALMN